MVNFSKGFFGKKRLIRRLFACALEITGNAISDVTVSINFVDEDAMRKLNNTYRKVDRITDVLSFPMLEIASDQKLKDFDGERNPDGELLLGDIVLCKKKVKQQAKEYKNSYKRELSYLIVHGFLHLMGYDHIKVDEERRMHLLTENILLNFGLERKGNE